MKARLSVVAACALLAACGSSSSDDGTSAADAGLDATHPPSDGAPPHDGAMNDASSPVDAAPPPVDAGGPGTVTFVNRCTFTVWVGALNNGTTSFLPENGGWTMAAGSNHTITLPAKWGGRFWGRTGCVFDSAGMGPCQTGDCGGRLQCNGAGGETPASLVEMQLANGSAKDFYDVSLVDGYNLPIGVAPQQGTFTRTDPKDPYDCGSPTCTGDANATCPDELKVTAGGRTVGCYSAHEACTKNPSGALDCSNEQDLYGCSAGGPNAVSGSCYSPGATSSCCGCPEWSAAGTCNGHNPKWELPSLPEKYAKVFKTACPSAYSFPFDDPTSTFTCRAASPQGTGYLVTFCP